MLTNKIFNASALATRLSRSADYSDNTLLLYNNTPYSCTTLHPIVVQLYTL